MVLANLKMSQTPPSPQTTPQFGLILSFVSFTRIHQSIADGTALLRLLCHSLADSQVIHIPHRPQFNSVSFCMNVFRACLLGPLTVLFWLLVSTEDCNLFTQRKTWNGSFTVSWSASITVPKVTEIALEVSDKIFQFFKIDDFLLYFANRSEESSKLPGPPLIVSWCQLLLELLEDCSKDVAFDSHQT